MNVFMSENLWDEIGKFLGFVDQIASVRFADYLALLVRTEPSFFSFEAPLYAKRTGDIYSQRILND